MKYFLGCASPDGFVSSFSDTLGEEGFYAYILKCGPGTGKSSLMKKLAAAFPDEDAELYFCSSDTASLDAVVLPKRRVIIADGTSPHVMEPRYPALSGEIVNLGEMWRRAELLKHREAITRCFEENAAYHARARRFVCAYSSLVSDICALASEGLLKQKAAAFAARFAAKNFRLSKRNTKAEARPISFRQLSAITAEGYKTFAPPYRTVFIHDDSFAAADFILRELAAKASEAGLRVLVSPLRLQEQTLFEHICIPEAELCVLSAGFFNGLEPHGEPETNSLRFYSRHTLSEKKQKLAFCRRACRELRGEAAGAIASALEIHDIIEKYYIAAMDFDAMNERSMLLEREIESR